MTQEELDALDCKQIEAILKARILKARILKACGYNPRRPT